MSAEPGTGTWLLARAGGPSRVPAGFDAMADGWRDIEAREAEAGIAPGQPILLSTGSVDYRLGDYFREAFRADQGSTAFTYATELRVWLTFLGRRCVTWDGAQSGDVRAFQVWRVYDERNPGRVSAATWNKGWAALRHFYGWAERRGWVPSTPVGAQQRLGAARGGFREKNARTSRDRWISPSDYRLWTLVGLQGYEAARRPGGELEAAMPRPGSRVRNSSRNVAFTDYAISTGLRLTEAASLLTVEVPSAVAEEALIVGKGRVRRHYQVMHAGALERLHAYTAGERRDAVRRAQRTARYEQLPGRLDVVQVLPPHRGSQRVRLDNGHVLDVATLDVGERARLFVRGPGGWEPAWLWLTEGGLAMAPPSWDKIFDAANERLNQSRQRQGRTAMVRVTAHSLRFTFALFVLLAAVRAIDEHLGLDRAEPYVERNYTQAFDHVRDLLGHASVETTKQVYLAPVKGLRGGSLFRGRSFADVWEGLSAVSPYVGFSR